MSLYISSLQEMLELSKTIWEDKKRKTSTNAKQVNHAKVYAKNLNKMMNDAAAESRVKVLHMVKKEQYLSWGSHPWARTGTVCGTASCTCWQSVQRDRAESWAAPWRTGLPARHQHHRSLRHRRPLRLRSPQTPPSPSTDASSAPGSARWHRKHTHTRAHRRPGASCCKTHTVPLVQVSMLGPRWRTASTQLHLV